MAEWLEGTGRPEDHAELLAHHYLAAIELARASGQVIGPFVEPALRVFREAGDRAFGLYAFEAASRFYGEAMTLVDDPDVDLRIRHAEALQRFGHRESERALEDACSALLEAGENERAAEAEALLAEYRWQRGDQEGGFAHLARAEELVQDAARTAAKARVLSQVTRYRAIAGQPELAIRAGEEALAIAERIGLAELIAQTLDNIAIARMNAGDHEGAKSRLERSIEIALSINSPEAARGYNNLSVAYAFAGDVRRSLSLREESVRVAERLGNLSIARFARGSLAGHLYPNGRWDDVLRVAASEVAESEHDPHVAECMVRRWRALVLHSRGDDDGAREDIDRALEIARRARDPQMMLPTLSIALLIAAELGADDDVRRLGPELAKEMSTPSYGPPELLLIDGFLVLAKTGLRDEYARVLALLPRERPWADVGWALVEERYVDAADALAEIGDVASEAHARLLAAEQLVAAGRRAEADIQLEQALAFYRSVGATRYIQRGETLLAASA